MNRLIHTEENVQDLTNDEISQFLDDLDHDGDGYINFSDVAWKLDQAHEELVAKLGVYHEVPRNHETHGCVRRAIVHDKMGGIGINRIHRDKFAHLVREQKIPSFQPTRREENDENNYLSRLPSCRRIRAYWAVHGLKVVFIGLVIAMQLAFGIWQAAKYLTTPQCRAGFGWGIVMAKACAGALYPTFFFLILSMSRYCSTWQRRLYRISPFFNWKLNREFHVRISFVVIILATLHAIGHLTGSFVQGSNPENQKEVAYVLGEDAVPVRYIGFVRSTPGSTGISGLALLYILSFLSMPRVRRWNYEIFQLGHVLMFPIVGLMMAHGTAALFQRPIFGYFLAFPALLVFIERVVRVFLGFRRIRASMKIVDYETVEVTVFIPSKRVWIYKAGQYVLLQVPEISFFQWHPFTVSFCRGNRMTVHFRTGGNWTRKLRQLGTKSGESEIEVGINGPFGAPAQHFHDFDYSVIVGTGIGITPFAGILADLQYEDDFDRGGPGLERDISPQNSDDAIAAASESIQTSQSNAKAGQNRSGLFQFPNGINGVNADPTIWARNSQPYESNWCADDYRRVDFHWLVRDCSHLRGLSDLLNDISLSQQWHREHVNRLRFDIRVNTHVTTNRKSTISHVYSRLLEMHRTEEYPASPLTGLLNLTRLGRPDFGRILNKHYHDMIRFKQNKKRFGESKDDGNKSGGKDGKLKVGVFYCGVPALGEILADKCQELTIRGRRDGSKIEYHFMMEMSG